MRAVISGLLLAMLVALCHFQNHDDQEEECNIGYKNENKLTVGIAKKRRYLLYDVNPGEGFNLRRDVYMRVAIFVKNLREYDDWILVLPPWGPLYHWKSEDIGKQIKIPWSLFFDAQSLNKFVPVLEMEEFLKEIGGNQIEKVFYLQHYPDMFKDGKWEEKYSIEKCKEESPYYSYDSNNKNYRGWFWGYRNNIRAKSFECLSLQGHASSLVPLLHNTTWTSVLFDRAEIMLHDKFGDVEYWKVRRSMQFSKKLIKVGDDFRKRYLNSTDLTDMTEVLEDWRDFKPSKGKALGGPYLAVHLRRGDFLYGRGEHVPSVKSAAEQIKKFMKKLKLKLIFIATDSTESEIEEFKKYIPEVVQYKPSSKEKLVFKDGGVAIIDQWICAHARFFIGTYESTFSFRIHEEREILGFHPNTTFNRLCGDNEKKCDRPSKWLIVYK